MNKILLFILFSVILEAAPIASSTTPADSTELIGEAFTSELCFDNTGTAVGYAPAYEVIVPNGINLNSASYESLNVKIDNFGTCAPTSPDLPPCNIYNTNTDVNRSVDLNETFYQLSLPLGSFVTDMGEQCITLNYTLDSSTNPNVVLGQGMDITIQPLFALGATAVDDGTHIYGAENSYTIYPNVYKIKKSNNAIEGETPTGPSYPITSTISVEIANSETLSSIELIDTLDDDMQYIGSLTKPAACSIITEPPTPAPAGGKLDLSCINMNSDFSITYQYYIQQTLSQSTGAWESKTNRVQADVIYQNTHLPTDEANATVIAKPITIHKTSSITNDIAPAGLTPGDTVRYDLHVRISDYFDFNATTITDTLSAGHEVSDNPASVVYSDPRYKLNSAVIYTDFNESNYFLEANQSNADGSRAFDFNVSDELQADGHGTLGKGDTLLLSLDAKVSDIYFFAGNPIKLTMGDSIQNDVNLSADINGSNISVPTDSSNAGESISVGTFSKSVYAINGSTAISAPYNVSPNDLVTFRLTRSLQVNSFNDMNITDYLPLPFFEVPSGGMTHDISAAIPDENEWRSGPSNNYTAIVGVDVNTSVSVTQNAISWYGSDDNNTADSIVDILFTLRATDAPLADSLELTNLATSSFKNSAGKTITDSGVVQVVTQEPELIISKRITNSTNPFSIINNNPSGGFNSALEKADAGDIVSYEVSLSNNGSFSAFDISLRDDFGQKDFNGTYHDNQGLKNCSAITFNSTGSSSIQSGDFLHTDLNISTMAPSEVVTITYSCEIDPLYAPGKDINNTASLLHYSNANGGPQFVNKPTGSSAKIELPSVLSITKDIYNSSIPETTPHNKVNQGELIDFNITIVVAEGNYQNFSIEDDHCTPLELDSATNIIINGNDANVTATSGSTPGIVKLHCDNYQALTSGTNTVSLKADNIDEVTASTSWQVIDPKVITNKSVTPDKLDGGDSTTIALSWSVDTNHPSYKCIITDPLNTTTFDTTSLTNINSSAGYSCSLIGSTFTCTFDSNTTACTNGSASFDINVYDNVVGGSTYTNKVYFEAGTLPSGHPGENNSSIDGNVTSEAGDDYTILAPEKPIKIFTSTSETFTDDHAFSIPDVAVGEVVDINMSFAFYQGITKTVTLEDVLFDNSVVYVPNSMFITRTSTNLEVSNSDINNSLGAANTPVAIADGNLTINANKIALSLGDVHNRNVSIGNASESFILSFRIKVQNNTKVQAGFNIRDRARVKYLDDASSTVRSRSSDYKNLHVLEPLIQITKSADKVVVDGNDSINFKLKICNDESNNSSDVTAAFDWTFSDVVPVELITTGSLVTINTNSTGAVANANFTGQTLNGTIDRLDVGECIEVDYNTTVIANPVIGSYFANDANVSATSLSGQYGSVGSNLGLSNPEPSELNGKRTGVNSGLNDYYDEAKVNMSIGNIVFFKRLRERQNYYAIGEQAQYRFTIGFPQGVTENFQVIDILPEGLSYVDGSFNVGITPPAVSVEHFPPIITQVGNHVIFDFGDLNASALMFASMDINVSVDNILANQDGISLINDANLSYGPSGAKTNVNIPFNPKPVIVGEPNLTLTEEIVSASTKIQDGQSINWKVTLNNSGHTTARKVRWIDILPIKLHKITDATLIQHGTISTLADTNTELNSSHFIILNKNSINDFISLKRFDMPVGSNLEITFKTETRDVIAGESFENNTSATYQSISDGGRDGSDGKDDDDNSVLNNYNAYASTEVNINTNISIDKILDSPQSAFTIGEHIGYRIRIHLIEGTTPTLRFTDIIPAGTTYERHNIEIGNAGMSYGKQGDINLGFGPTVFINLGDVKNPANGNTNDDYLDIELTLHVDNKVANQNGVSMQNGHGGTADVYVDYNGTQVSIPKVVTTTVVEPNLTINKTTDDYVHARGEEVEYTLTLTHTATSTSDAYGVRVKDVLPNDLHYVANSVSGATATENNGTITFYVPILQRSNSPLTITYKASVDNNATYGIELENNASLTYKSIPFATGQVDSGRDGSDGIGGALNDYAANDTARIMPSNAAFLKTIKDVNWSSDNNGNNLIDAGDTLSYHLSITNEGNITANDLTWSDPLPVETQYLIGTIELSGDYEVAEDSASYEILTQTLIADIKDLAVGETIYIDYNVTIKSSVVGVVDIINQSTTDSNETIPTLSFWGELNSSEPSPTIISTQIRKEVHPAPLSTSAKAILALLFALSALYYIQRRKNGTFKHIKH